MKTPPFVLRDIIRVDGEEVDLLSYLPTRRGLIDLDLVTVRLLARGRVDAEEPFAPSFVDHVGPLNPADMPYDCRQRSASIAARPASRKKLPMDIFGLPDKYSSNISYHPA